MPPRLSELYRPGDRVQVCFEAAEEAWRPARVLGPQTPGLWVQTEEDGRHWFVTNGRRIRPDDAAAKGSEC